MEIIEIIALFRWMWVVAAEYEEAEAVNIMLNRCFLELVKRFVTKTVDKMEPAEQAFIRIGSSLGDYNYFKYESGTDALGVRNSLNLILHRYMAYDKEKTWEDFGNVDKISDPATARLATLYKTFSKADFTFKSPTTGKDTSFMPIMEQFFDPNGPNGPTLRSLYNKDGKLNPIDNVMYLFYINVRRAMARYDWNNNVSSFYVWPDLTHLPIVDYAHKPRLVNRITVDPKSRYAVFPPSTRLDEDGQPLPLTGADYIELARYRKWELEQKNKPKN